ncbi:MAG: 1-deoxy-D-xylulose-5-phosphate reductoisomerase [Azospirillaceae bacterium]|nr:1-deoxy-D-xylulose-5-phosphate reductoisomerase [Azospirillaceae bacterium]
MMVLANLHRAAEPAVAPRRVTVLGSTGSVGCNTLDVMAHHKDRFVVEALTAGRNVDRLVEQAIAVRARLAVIADPDAYDALKAGLAGTGIEAAAGPAAVVEAAQRPSDFVMAAIVGAAGLEPTLAATRRGAKVAFANKECLVCAGALMMALVRDSGATLLPVDSEHSAIFQVFDFDKRAGIRRLILTASGGPFRQWSREAMVAVTPRQAVAHPTWSMGAKISVDSASMMNKGLEIIEAHHLFAMPEDAIDVVVHPQSVIHSMVEYVDGSVLAQMGTPDMRTPIAFALAWPGRIETAAQRLDLAQCRELTFEAPDPERFPALRLAREALRAGGGAPTILNAANEIAVQAFLTGRIGFLGIERVVEEALTRLPHDAPADVAEVRQIDLAARRTADQIIATRVGSIDA